MPNLPIKPNVKSYRGLKEKLHRRVEMRNRMAHRVIDHVNRLIANNPAEAQEYFFGTIAGDLGLTAEDVCAAITDGTYNGITLRVTEDDRRALSRYKSA